MKKKPATPPNTAELRSQAEAKLSERKKKTAAFPATESDPQRLVHELEVHQIELEMQNEEIIQSRAQVEAVLRKYTDLYDFAPIGYFTLARDSAIHQTNLAGANLLGVERAALIKRRFGVFVSAQSGTTFSAFLDDVFTSRSKKTCEVTLRKDGSPPLLVHIEAITKDEQPEVCHTAVVDITERKNMQEALRVSETRYRRLFESAKDGILILDAETGIIVDMNPFLIEMIGYSNEPFKGKAVWELGFFKDVAASKEKFVELQQREYIRYEDLPLKTKDGKKMDVEFISNVYHVNGTKTIQCIIRDISERKRSEEKLKAADKKETERKLMESKSRLLESQQIAKIGSWEWDIEKNILWWSDELYHIFGVMKDKFKFDYNTIENCIHPDDRDRNQRMVDRLYKGKCVEPIEMRILMPDGSIKWIYQIVDTIKNKSGTIIASKGIIQDITERKQAEDALRENRDLLGATQQIAHVGGWEWDVDRQTMTWTAETYRIHGMVPGELTAGSPEHINLSLACYNPADRPIVEAAFRRCAEKGQPYDLELPLIRTDGHQIWIHTKARAVKEGDHVVKVVGNIMDITDRKISEEQLYDAQERYKSIYNCSLQMVYICDFQGKFLDANQTTLDLLGYTKEEITSISFSSLLDQEQHNQSSLIIESLIKSENQSEPKQYKIRCKDGQHLYIETVSALVYQNERPVSIQGTARNITKQKIAEEQTKEAHHIVTSINTELKRQVAERTKEIERLLKQKDEFINQLGHDLKNPLGPFVSLLPVLQKKEHDPKKKEILTVLHRNVGYMTNLVKKTIALAQLNSPNAPFHFEQTNLLEEILRILETNKMILKERHIKVHTNVSKEIYVPADKLRLEELFTNLINNAVKYTKDDGGTITIDAIDDNKDATISIQDNGIGMTSDQLQHIFDEFFKADPARHDLDSSGLGLTICKRIVEKHGGTIWAESEGLGKGSTFKFILPK